MPQEPIKTLSIVPGSRYVGYAAFRGPELLDWGVRVIRAKTLRGRTRAAGAILIEALERHQPDRLVIKRLHQSRSSEGLDRLTQALKELARRRKLKISEYSIGQVKQAILSENKGNKRRLAEYVAAQYPVLNHDLQKELANRNPYYLRMFEAVALGFVCYERVEQEINS